MGHEFAAIRHMFQARAPFQHPLTSLGNGDDASVHGIPLGMELVISTDAAVSGVHWPLDMPLDMAAKRAIGAALSDLAAMGADPTWIWLSVVAKDMQGLQAMSDGVVEICQQYQVELAGGDTVHASLEMLNVTVAGLLPEAQAMKRTKAQAGDDIWLLGDLGLSALGLQQWQQGVRESVYVEAFQCVKPLLQQGVQLRQLGVACCMDVSDGLLQDAGHIAQASGLALAFDWQLLQQLPAYTLLQNQLTEEDILPLLVAGGEDFALLFTAKPALKAQLEGLAAVRIGVCQAGQGVALLDHGQEIKLQTKGYDHFGA